MWVLYIPQTLYLPCRNASNRHKRGLTPYRKREIEPGCREALHPSIGWAVAAVCSKLQAKNNADNPTIEPKQDILHGRLRHDAEYTGCDVRL